MKAISTPLEDRALRIKSKYFSPVWHELTRSFWGSASPPRSPTLRDADTQAPLYKGFGDPGRKDPKLAQSRMARFNGCNEFNVPPAAERLPPGVTAHVTEHAWDSVY